MMVVIYFELAVVGCVERVDTRRGQGQQPVNIGWGDEMPSRSQHMGAQNRPFRKCLLNNVISSSAHAQAERPFGTREILRLHRSKPLHNLGRARKWVSGNV